MSGEFRPKSKLWAVVGFDGDRDFVQFESKKEFNEWKKVTKCVVIKLIKGTEQTIDQKKSA